MLKGLPCYEYQSMPFNFIVEVQQEQQLYKLSKMSFLGNVFGIFSFQIDEAYT